MAFIVVSVILCAAFGIIHYTNVLMPYYASLMIGLNVLIISMKMLLSDLFTSLSLKPGVSIRVKSPTVPIYTQGVTALNEDMLLNLHGYLVPL